jgi:hypothetical protein
MANTTAWTSGSPKSTGDQVTAAEFNALDDGQVAAIVRGGTSALTAAVSITGLATYDFTFDGHPKVSGLIEYRQQGGAPLYITNTTDWVFSPTLGGFYEHANGGILYQPIDHLVEGGTLTGVYVTIWGNAGAGFAGALPAVMPYIKVRKMAGTTGTVSQLGSTTTDTSADVAALNTIHVLSVTGLNESISQENNKHRYFVEIGGAGGANYVNDTLQIIEVRAVFTPSKIHPG